MINNDTLIKKEIRKKCKNNGINSLTDCELLTLIIREGDPIKDVDILAHSILKRYNGLNALLDVEVDELTTKNPGLSEIKAIDILASLELGKRACKPCIKDTTVNSPDVVFKILQKEMNLLSQENFKVVLLNTKNMIISIEDIS